MNIVKEIKDGDFKAVISRDEDPPNPITNYDSLGIMVCRSNRYDLGHTRNEPEFGTEVALKLPLYLSDHSGITISTEPFNCPFDSGRVGYIYITKAHAIEAYGKGYTQEQLRVVLISQVKEYDEYLTGNCFGFQVFWKDIELESCWGFLGDPSYCEEEALDAMRAAKEEIGDPSQIYPTSDWKAEVANGTTTIGLDKWRSHLVEDAYINSF